MPLVLRYAPRALVPPSGPPARAGAQWRRAARAATARRACATPSASGMAAVSFSHVHMYCDSLKELEEYKQLEQKLNSFVEKAGPAARASGSRQGADVAEGRSKWLELSGVVGNPVTGEKDPSKWTPSRQDVVEQMLVGLGWRITGVCQKGDTRTFVITSKDPSGVKFVVTAHNKLD